MERTPFAGLTVLAPGEPLSTDGYSFSARNPKITDTLLKVGCVTHRHNGAAALSRPTGAPSASVVASGGTLPADTSLMIGYTCIDAQGGETLVSPVVSVTTPPLMQPPSSPPVASADYSGGSLRIDTYFYLRSFVDDGGGETTPSPYVTVARAPGFASGQVLLSGLTQGMASAGAVGWKVYKSDSTGQFKFLASGDIATDSLIDNGTLCPDCIQTPTTVNTTHTRNSLLIDIPGSLPPGTTSFRIYASVGAGFFDPSLIGSYDVSNAGAVFTYTTYNPASGKPPDVATAIGGANQIDPDTDILDWHWKRPVTASAALGSGVVGDVRMAEDEHRLYTPSGPVARAGHPEDWMPVVTLPGRRIATASALLGASAAALMSIEMAPSYEVFRVVTNTNARVRLYAGTAYQAADAGRASATAPSGDHGVVLDQVNNGGDFDTAVAPGAAGMNLDAVDATIPLTLENLNLASGAVSVALTYLPRE